jgi:sigma-B regulation protein RsbU (phosphoserine phosphatase)
MIFRRGEVLKPQVEGIPIGLLEDRQYEEVQFQTEPGDMVLFFSDGVADQLNAKDEEFSRGRVSRLLKSHGTGSPEGVAGAIFSELDTFRDGTSITDDQTVVAVKVSG